MIDWFGLAVSEPFGPATSRILSQIRPLTFPSLCPYLLPDRTPVVTPSWESEYASSRRLLEPPVVLRVRTCSSPRRSTSNFAPSLRKGAKWYVLQFLLLMHSHWEVYNLFCRSASCLTVSPPHLLEQCTTPQIAKLVSAAWKSMTKEEREPWDLMAIRDKARFHREMANYKGPVRVLKGAYAKKDPNAPKRPTTAFLAYSNAKRDTVMAKHPKLRATEVSVILSGMWKDEDPAVKKQFMEQAAAQRDDYKRQMLQYKQRQKGESAAMMQAMEGWPREALPAFDPAHPHNNEAEEIAQVGDDGNESDWDPLPAFADDSSCTDFEHPFMPHDQDPMTHHRPGAPPPMLWSTQHQEQQHPAVPPASAPSFWHTGSPPSLGRAVTDKLEQSQTPWRMVMCVMLPDTSGSTQPHQSLPHSMSPTGPWFSGTDAVTQQQQHPIMVDHPTAWCGPRPTPMLGGGGAATPPPPMMLGGGGAATVTPEQPPFRQMVSDNNLADCQATATTTTTTAPIIMPGPWLLPNIPPPHRDDLSLMMAPQQQGFLPESASSSAQMMGSMQQQRPYPAW